MSGAFVFWKAAHILSASILLGTGLGIAFFCWFALGIPAFAAVIAIYYLMAAKSP